MQVETAKALFEASYSPKGESSGNKLLLPCDAKGFYWHCRGARVLRSNKFLTNTASNSSMHSEGTLEVTLQSTTPLQEF